MFIVSSPLSSSPLRQSLSPRDPNVPASPRAFPSKPAMLPSPTPSRTPRTSPNTSSISSTPSGESAYSKRVTKANPLIHGRSSSTSTDGREARRKLFLKKVREDAEDKRWKARGGDDEMMRSIWISEQRRREEKQRRESIELDALVDEEEYLSLDEMMVDEIALREEAELEALAALITEQAVPAVQNRQQEVLPEDKMDSLLFPMEEQVPENHQEQLSSETLYGSDDEEEYDHIFMDVIEEENRLATQSSQPLHEDDMMDMS